MISVVGMGTTPLSEAARARIEQADLVVGASRHLARVQARQIRVLDGDLDAALDAVEAQRGNVAVLASGDPGFFGIVRALGDRFGRQNLDVHPSLSSVTLVFARAGLSWEDALVVSAHGRDPRFAINTCRAHPKVAVLTSPTFSPADLASALSDLRRTCVVGEHLGGQDERVLRGSLDEVATMQWSDPNVIVVLDEDRLATGKSRSSPPRLAPESWALPEDAFEHPESMITKSEVRALALARLGPGVGDLVWDVGAGSGSVGIECARLGAATIAVEREGDLCSLITRNAARHRVALTLVHGSAPEALEKLPEPDAVFVGGGGSSLEAALEVVAARVRRTVVVALAGVERVEPARRALLDGDLDVDVSLVQVARFKALGDVHRLAPVNPVFLVAGVRS